MKKKREPATPINEPPGSGLTGARRQRPAKQQEQRTNQSTANHAKYTKNGLGSAEGAPAHATL